MQIRIFEQHFDQQDSVVASMFLVLMLLQSCVLEVCTVRETTPTVLSMSFLKGMLRSARISDDLPTPPCPTTRSRARPHGIKSSRCCFSSSVLASKSARSLSLRLLQMQRIQYPEQQALAPAVSTTKKKLKTNLQTSHQGK